MGGRFARLQKERMMLPQHKVNGQWKRDRKVTVYEMSRKQREFDPILQSYIHPEKESALRSQEQSRRM